MIKPVPPVDQFLKEFRDQLDAFKASPDADAVAKMDLTVYTLRQAVIQTYIREGPGLSVGKLSRIKGLCEHAKDAISAWDESASMGNITETLKYIEPKIKMMRHAEVMHAR